VPAAGIARVAGEQSVLNFVAWHCNPAPVDQHLQADRRYSERRGRTVALIAARRSFAIRKMRVDVVGGGRLRSDTPGQKWYDELSPNGRCALTHMTIATFNSLYPETLRPLTAAQRCGSNMRESLPLENWEGTPLEALLGAAGIILGTPAVIALALVTWTRSRKRLPELCRARQSFTFCP